MADGLVELQAALNRVDISVRRLGRAVGHPLGKMSNEEVNRQARVVFGSDRKFSGAKRSKNAKRSATVNYKVVADGVLVYPSGDPWYIFMLGRGRSDIRPSISRALRTPRGPRASAHGGRMAPRPQVLDPAVEAIGDRAPDIIADALIQVIDGAL